MKGHVSRQRPQKHRHTSKPKAFLVFVLAAAACLFSIRLPNQGKQPQPTPIAVNNSIRRLHSYKLSCAAPSACRGRSMLEVQANDCTSALLHTAQSAVVAHLGAKEVNQEDTPPLILLLKRTGCRPHLGSEALLQHPRVYFVVTNMRCFGDHPYSTYYINSWQEATNTNLLDTLTKRVERLASIAFPPRPKEWTSWKRYMQLMEEAYSTTDDTIRLRYNEQYDTVMVPLRIREPSPLNTTCELNSVPELPLNRKWNVRVSDKFLETIWLGNALQNVLSKRLHPKFKLVANDSSTSDFLFLSRVQTHGNTKIETCDAALEDGGGLNTGEIPVIFAQEDMGRQSCSNAMNVDTWSTSVHSCPSTDVAFALPPMLYLEDNMTILRLPSKEYLQESYNIGEKRWLASFVGTHYKDRYGGAYGIIRHLIQSLNSEKDKVLIYTHCHKVHADTECAERHEAERLEKFADKGPFLFSQSTAKSKFCLVPKGRQPASYRWLEMVIGGCIPVYLSDPGDDYIWSQFLGRQIPWEKTSFYIHGRTAGQLVPFFKSIKNEEWLQRKEALANISAKYFSSLPTVATALLEEMYLAQTEFRNVKANTTTTSTSKS